MRIIAGTHRGRRIEAPEGLDTRPTTDRVRESIMSSIFSMTGGFEGLNVLDACSGSGAMGLEALSRGADTCVLNDLSARSRDVIRSNRDRLGYGDERARIMGVDALAACVPAAFGAFDLVFLDPPYATEASSVMAALADADGRGLLAPGWVAVYEHEDRLDDEMPGQYGLKVLAEKRYGKTRVTFLAAGDRC